MSSSNNSETTSLLNEQNSLSLICWSITAILLLFILLSQLAVLISFALKLQVSPVIAPLTLLISLCGGYLILRRKDLPGRIKFVPLLIVLGIIAVSLILAEAFYDMSWDGLWYHQTAVYQMSSGWNPIYDPMHNFVPHLQSWLRYYAKGPWYFALTLYQITGNIETAKAAPWIMLAVSFFTVLAACLDFGIKKRNSIIIASLVSLNPVVICQLASYLVDGLLISFLTCFAAALFRWFKNRSTTILIILIASAILSINAKLTGLVYLCFFIAAGGVYLLLKQRKLFWRYAVIQISVILIGIIIFGFNPYVTNTINRGHPFYPILGNAAHPSYSDLGQDPIEMFETPHNMVGQNRFVRFYYAIFGRPGSQPFFQGENAKLMFPFDVGWKDFQIFYFHEVRISGFGPFFSGVLIISLFLFGMILYKTQVPRIVILIFIVTIIPSLLISIHSWWARYAPQLWWLPVTAIIFGLISYQGWTRRLAYILAAVLLINSTLIAIVHFNWEIEATHTTNAQIAMLLNAKDIEIDFQYFGEPFGRRLHNAGVSFHAVPNLQCMQPLELMSVAPGYPGAVRTCIKNN